MMNPTIKPKDDNTPKIAIGFLRNLRTGDIDRIRLAPFTPGMLIERGKHVYQVDSKGTQRRVR